MLTVFLRVALMYQPSCLLPCCQGKQGELAKKQLSKPQKQFILSLGISSSNVTCLVTISSDAPEDAIISSSSLVMLAMVGAKVASTPILPPKLPANLRVGVHEQ